MRCDVCSFADDTTRFILTELEEHSIISIEWFESDYIKMNSDKCELFISESKFEHLWTKIGNNRICENRTVKLVDIAIDNELKFDEHLSNVCLKANRKLPAITRIRKYLYFKNIRIRFKGFFVAQFNYSPLTCVL